eukprot:2170452-Rhodomonas_salina.2
MQEMIVCQHRRSRAFSTLQQAFHAKLLAIIHMRAGRPPSSSQPDPGPLLRRRRNSARSALPALGVGVNELGTIAAVSPLITAGRRNASRHLEPPPLVPALLRADVQPEAASGLSSSIKAEVERAWSRSESSDAAHSDSSTQSSGSKMRADAAARVHQAQHVHQAQRVMRSCGDDLEQALERVFLLAMTNPGGVLDAKVKESSRQVQRCKRAPFLSPVLFGALGRVEVAAGGARLPTHVLSESLG